MGLLFTILIPFIYTFLLRLSIALLLLLFTSLYLNVIILKHDVNRNVVYPTIFFNPNRDEEVYNNAIEITELNSDEDTSENEQNNNNHEWCNITDTSEEQEDDYKVTDKKYQSNENENIKKNISEKCNDDVHINQFCTDFYGIDCHDRGEDISKVNNLHSELFTTINNNYRASDTSSDSNQYDNIEVIQCNEEDTKENDYWNSNDLYDNRNVIYDYDDNAEKRTIWIYALKNQRYLAEHDYELINIPGKDSTSTTDDEELSKNIPRSRNIATPIPTYIPTVNFSISPTLPTVTEVIEPINQSSNDSDISTNNTKLIQKPLNGWFENETTKTQIDNQNPGKMEMSYESNWQALPSRKRRRLRRMKINEQNILNSGIEPDAHEYCETKIIIRNKEFRPELHVEGFEKQIDEIDHECNQDTGINYEKEEISLEHSNDCTFVEESLSNPHKLQLKIGAEMKKFNKDITDPIEKLEGNWIGQSLPNNNGLLEVQNYNVIPAEDNYDFTQRTAGAIEECTNDCLIIRNTSLLKPAEWTQYLPSAVSVPSLHLSLSVDTDFDTEKKSCFKRFLRFVNCCK